VGEGHSESTLDKAKSTQKYTREFFMDLFLTMVHGANAAQYVKRKSIKPKLESLKMLEYSFA